MRKEKFAVLVGALLLALLLSVGVSAETPVSAHGKLAVKGTQLVDKNGEAFQVHGVSTHGLSWYPQYVSKTAFKELRDKWGVNTVRLAMYTAEYNGYCVGGAANQETLKALVDTGVKAAASLGMYVIIDWHILSDGNPATYEKEALAFFQEMAKKYKDYDNVLYEICNEPNGGTSWAQIKTYAEKVIKGIRRIDGDAIILVGTPNWSQDVDIAAKDPITGYKNIMYTLHFYADTHKDAYRQKAQAALDAGLPLFVSEFGICDASGNGSVNEAEGDQWSAFMERNGIGCVAWNLSNKSEACALLLGSCTKTSGWTLEDLSQSGKWLVRTYGGSLAGSGSTGSAGSSGGSAGTGSSGSTGSGSGGAGSSDSAGTGSSGSAGGGSGSGGTGSSGSTTSSGQTVKASSKNCKATVKKMNSWESSGRYYAQYRLTIRNTGKAAVTNWKVRVTFKYGMRRSQQWNGAFSYGKKTVTISPASWNSRIEVKGKVTDIGFIVSSTKKNKVVSVKFR